MPKAFHTHFSALIALTLIGSGNGLNAQPAEDLEACKGKDAGTKLVACTRIIERGEAMLAKDRAIALQERGYAYLAGGQLDSAIADFELAIALNPSDASGFLNRGNAYAVKGLLNRAIADYDQA